MAAEPASRLTTLLPLVRVSVGVGILVLVAFLALSQLTSLNRCQQLPSIINMQVPNCVAQASEMTEADLAFLRGLYQMPLGNNLREQKDFIRYQMMSGRDGK